MDLFENPQQILEESEKAGIAVVAVTNAPSVFERVETWTVNLRNVQAALGLHPQLVEERARELDLMWQLFGRTRYIGEVGLDYTNSDAKSRQRQREVFNQILERCEIAGDKILTVHSRRAAADVVSAIGRGVRSTVILHWYSGSLSLLERAIENGLYFSINLAMFRSKNGSQIIKMLPRERVLTETDGPFVSIGPFPVRPVDVGKTVEKLAEVWGGSMEETRKLLISNYRRCIELRR